VVERRFEDLTRSFALVMDRIAAAQRELSTLGSCPFQAEPPACHQASRQLHGLDLHQQVPSMCMAFALMSSKE
jgi:hypothetical protein